MLAVTGCAVTVEEAVEEEAVAFADAHGWTRVSSEELARAQEIEGVNLRQALGAAAIMVAGDDVYRLDSLDVPEELGAFAESGTAPVSAAASSDIGVVRSPVIVGTDDRTPVTSGLRNAPARQVGRLFTRLVNGGGTITFNRCTGTLIGPRHVVTSGHCFSPLTNNVMFQPARNGANNTFPSIFSSFFFVYGTGSTNDIALVVFPDTAATASRGFHKLRTARSSDEDRSISIRGYPGANQWCWTAPRASFPRCGGFMYRSDCELRSVAQELEYRCDTTGGMSGSGITFVSGRTRYLIGVHKGEDDDLFVTQNRAVRIVPNLHFALCTVMHAFPSSFGPLACA
ncbi:MAG: trypsin-like peptidase domain-containing protein [Myxococcota bacterium]